MDISKLQGGIKTLTAQMDKAASGSGAAADIFKELGIAVTKPHCKVFQTKQNAPALQVSFSAKRAPKWHRCSINPPKAWKN